MSKGLKGMKSYAYADEEIAFMEIPMWRRRKNKKTKDYMIYVIHVYMVSGFRWVVEKRYSEFLRFLRTLKKCDALEGIPKLKVPRKRWFTSFSDSCVKERRNLFNRIFDTLVSMVGAPQELYDFLELNAPGTNLKKSLSVVYQRKGLMRNITDLNLPIDLTQDFRSCDFQLLKVIGQGSFGRVFLVRAITLPSRVLSGTTSPGGASRKSLSKPFSMMSTDSLSTAAVPFLSEFDEVYAMKVLRKKDVVKRKQVEHTKAERNILAMLNHPFLLNLLYAFQSAEKLYMLMEFCPGGEMFFHLKRLKRFDSKQAKFYAMQLALALQYLHDKKIVYRDLKPENILLCADGYVKLTDFGLSKYVGDGREPKTFCGTPEYLAPETILHQRNRTGYSFPVDWWGLGIVLFEMMTGWPPFFDRSFEAMCEKILHKPVRFPSKYKVAEEVQSFVGSLLIRDPGQRCPFGLASIKSHPFFAKDDWDSILMKEMPAAFMPNECNTTDDTVNFNHKVTDLKVQQTPSHSFVGDFGGLDELRATIQSAGDAVDIVLPTGLDVPGPDSPDAAIEAGSESGLTTMQQEAMETSFSHFSFSLVRDLEGTEDDGSAISANPSTDTDADMDGETDRADPSTAAQSVDFDVVQAEIKS
jgi:serine/threonine protein kinase